MFIGIIVVFIVAVTFDIESADTLMNEHLILDEAAKSARAFRSERDQTKPGPGIDQVVIAAQKIHTTEAYTFMDRLIAARDPVTGLLPLHVKTEGEKLVSVDHSASGIDMGRATAGLVMLSVLARAEGDIARADKYLKVAEENYKRGKELLSEGDYFVHWRDFDDRGNPTTTAIGEQDNMSRVNPRAYAFRAAAELHRATGQESYKLDFERYFKDWVQDFYDADTSHGGGFFIHANVTNPSDHNEIGPFKDPGGADLRPYDGRRGVKGNDGTIYALSAVLLEANEILGTEQTQNLVKEQLDLILDKLHRQHGMLWENYTNDWKPISVGWQSQSMDAPEGSRTSHVSIGGHTAMAPQQIIEGARQLLKQKKISETEYELYIHRAVILFQEFATQSGAIDWDKGVVHNAIRVEEPRIDHRWIQPWGDAAWQQAELIQTLLRFRQEGRLKDIKDRNGMTGEELLKLAEEYYVTSYPVPAQYEFKDFANPDVYHRPQLALYHHEVTSQLNPQKLR